MKLGLKAIFTVVCVAMAFAGSARAASSEHEALFTFVDRIAQHILTQKYQELSSLHHYPGASNSAYAGEDRCHIESNLRDLVDQFGDLKSMKPLNERVMFVGLGSGHGHEGYWQQQPQAYTFTYQAEFSKAGSGILKLEVVNFTDHPELKSIQFGLPASEQSMSLLQTIASEVYQAREQRQSNHICRAPLQS